MLDIAQTVILLGALFYIARLNYRTSKLEESMERVSIILQNLVDRITKLEEKLNG